MSGRSRRRGQRSAKQGRGRRGRKRRDSERRRPPQISRETRAGEAGDGDTLAPGPPPPRLRKPAEAGGQESAIGSPEGASAAEGAGRPRARAHSPQAGAVHSGHGTWGCGVATRTERSRGDKEDRERGCAAKRAGAKTGREALKKEAGGRAQGRNLAGPARPSLRPSRTAAPPGHQAPTGPDASPPPAS